MQGNNHLQNTHLLQPVTAVNIYPFDTSHNLLTSTLPSWCINCDTDGHAVVADETRHHRSCLRRDIELDGDGLAAEKLSSETHGNNLPSACSLSRSRRWPSTPPSKSRSPWWSLFVRSDPIRFDDSSRCPCVRYLAVSVSVTPPSRRLANTECHIRLRAVLTAHVTGGRLAKDEPRTMSTNYDAALTRNTM